MPSLAHHFQTRLPQSEMTCYWSELNNGRTKRDAFDNINHAINNWLIEIDRFDPAKLSPFVAVIMKPALPPNYVANVLYSYFVETARIAPKIRTSEGAHYNNTVGRRGLWGGGEEFNGVNVHL